MRMRLPGMTHHYHVDGTWLYEFEGDMIVVEKPENLPKVREDPTLISDLITVKMNLKLSPIHEVYEYSKHMTIESLELGKKAGDQHWEQIGLVNGEIQIGTEKIAIQNTLGQRDHTHGIRDWTGIDYWLYYVVWFDENLAINPAAIIADDGRSSIGEFLFKNGKNIPLKSIKIIDQQFREDGIFPISSELELVDALGDTHTLKGVVESLIPVPFKDKEGNQSFLIQAFGNFKLDGVKGGYGTFETLRKAKKK